LKVKITESLWAPRERNIPKNNRKSFHQGVETKLFVSAIIRGEDCTIAKRYIVTAIMLRNILALSHNTLGLWRKVVASESYRSRKQGAVIATFKPLSLLKVIDLTAKKKR
jgi:hypothetical protein